MQDYFSLFSIHREVRVADQLMMKQQQKRRTRLAPTTKDTGREHPFFTQHPLAQARERERRDCIFSHLFLHPAFHPVMLVDDCVDSRLYNSSHKLYREGNRERGRGRNQGGRGGRFVGRKAVLIVRPVALSFGTK